MPLMTCAGLRLRGDCTLPSSAPSVPRAPQGTHVSVPAWPGVLPASSLSSWTLQPLAATCQCPFFHRPRGSSQFTSSAPPQGTTLQPPFLYTHVLRVE